MPSVRVPNATCRPNQKEENGKDLAWSLWSRKHHNSCDSSPNQKNKNDDDGDDDDDGNNNNNNSFPAALIHVLTESASDDESSHSCAAMMLVPKSLHLHEHYDYDSPTPPLPRDQRLSNNVLQHLISENSYNRVSATHSHCDVHACRSQTCCACRSNNDHHRTPTKATTPTTTTTTTTTIFLPVTQVISPREIKFLPHKWWEVGWNWKDSYEETSSSHHNIVDRITSSLFFASLAEDAVPAE